MDQAVSCCQNPAALTNAQSPFSRILALGFYDGPTSGVLQCATCSTVYNFDMLDWDDDHRVRIFRLAALPSDSLTQCVQALAQSGPPRWPVWVPSRWNLPSEESREVADRAVQHILDRAQPAGLVVAWVGYGERILAAQKVPVEDLANVPDWFSGNNTAEGRDWFSFLGLVRRRIVA